MGLEATHKLQIWIRKGHQTEAYLMEKEILIHPENRIRLSDINPHDGPLMLDDVAVTNSVTSAFFTLDLGTVITANPIHQA